MNRAALTAATAITAALLAACSSAPGTPKPVSSGQATATSSTTPATSESDATSAFAVVSATVPSAKIGTTVTAESDPNHLLGRPHQYTSKVTFTDGRIPAADTDGKTPDDLALGGSIESFSNAADAKARADYIQAATSSLPMLTEYHYLHGTTLIRVTHLLTPTQAADYEKAAAKLP
ncbi:hypothetical protein ACFV9E_30560 [Streptomyces sp. NPDC059835]|uniref:hypothetical protein n=1 Tax=Streptomyces sp. NPDC059835 TaxID=3346967 RepID=UPI003653BC45